MLIELKTTEMRDSYFAAGDASLWRLSNEKFDKGIPIFQRDATVIRAVRAKE